MLKKIWINGFKKRGRFSGRVMKILALCMMVLLLTAGTGITDVSAEGGVSATIQFGEQMDSSAYDQAIELGLFRIGTYTGSGYEMVPAFSYAADLSGATAEETDAIIERVESDVKGSDGSFKTPDYSTKVVGSTAEFTGVAPGA